LAGYLYYLAITVEVYEPMKRNESKTSEKAEKLEKNRNE
jgi:hypothetical protein